MTLDKRRIRRAFDRAAPGYEAQAVLQREVCNRLLERLDYVKLAPSRVLDAGSGPGLALRGLAKRYPRAAITALDLSPAMLARTPRLGLFRRAMRVCGDAETLPFSDGSIDLVFSNLMLQWCAPPDRALAEFRRVLAPGGLLLFATFGPDTLKELRAAWAQVDRSAHIHDFPDMHDVGDAMLRAGFDGPVMDREDITLTYPDAMRMMREIREIGAGNADPRRPRGLTGRKRLSALRAALDEWRTPEGLLPSTWEVVYGHAWAPSAPPPSSLNGRPVIPLYPERT